MDEVLGRNTKSQIGGVVKGHWNTERMDSILLSTNHKMILSSFEHLFKSLWGNFFCIPQFPLKNLTDPNVLSNRIYSNHLGVQRTKKHQNTIHDLCMCGVFMDLDSLHSLKKLLVLHWHDSKLMLFV